MKNALLTLMLILFLIYPNSILASTKTKDTTSFLLKKTNIDIKPDIIRQIVKSFSNEKFDSLIIFIDSYVDFFYVSSSGKYISRNLTDYGVLSEVEDFFSTFEYRSFKVLNGLNQYNEDIIQVYIFPTNITTVIPDVIVSFVLDKKQIITAIAIQ